MWHVVNISQCLIKKRLVKKNTTQKNIFVVCWPHLRDHWRIFAYIGWCIAIRTFEKTNCAVTVSVLIYVCIPGQCVNTWFAFSENNWLLVANCCPPVARQQMWCSRRYESAGCWLWPWGTSRAFLSPRESTAQTFLDNTQKPLSRSGKPNKLTWESLICTGAAPTLTSSFLGGKFWWLFKFSLSK